MAFAGRLGDNSKTYARIFHQFLECFLVLHLYDDTRIFGEQDLDDVLFRQLVEVHIQTAFHICKTHFEQCRYHTSGRNIVSGQDQALFDRILYGVERILEIFRVLYGRHFVAELVQYLCESGTTQLHRVEREVYIIKVRILFVSQYRRNNLADVAYFGAGGDNNRTRSNHLVVAILLRHGQRVLACRDIDT